MLSYRSRFWEFSSFISTAQQYFVFYFFAKLKVLFVRVLWISILQVLSAETPNSSSQVQQYFYFGQKPSNRKFMVLMPLLISWMWLQKSSVLAPLIVRVYAAHKRMVYMIISTRWFAYQLAIQTESPTLALKVSCSSVNGSSAWMLHCSLLRHQD